MQIGTINIAVLNIALGRVLRWRITELERALRDVPRSRRRKQGAAADCVPARVALVGSVKSGYTENPWNFLANTWLICRAVIVGKEA